MTSTEIISEIELLLDSKTKTLKVKLSEICGVLKTEVSHYDWVGFYFANHAKKTLHLGPFAGEETDHTFIPFGKGICGQVAESNETFMVEDVHAQDNYIACSIHVKSEIVIPLFVKDKNVGQIDIDSNTPNAFSSKDETLLKAINASIAKTITAENVDVLDLV